MTDARLPDQTARTWSQHFRERSHVLIFIRDAVIALIVFVGLSGVAWALAFVLGFVSLFAGGASFQTLAVLPVYGIPALVVGYGVIKARPGVMWARCSSACAAPAQIPCDCSLWRRRSARSNCC